jgi:hypothetical protein
MLFLSVIKWPSRTPDTEIRSRSMTFAIELTVHNETVRYTDGFIYLTRLTTGVHKLSENEDPFFTSTKIFVIQVCPPITGNTLLPRLRETADNTERYI